jgi:hypothetical protein
MITSILEESAASTFQGGIHAEFCWKTFEKLKSTWKNDGRLILGKRAMRIEEKWHLACSAVGFVISGVKPSGCAI